MCRVQYMELCSRDQVKHPMFTHLLLSSSMNELYFFKCIYYFISVFSLALTATVP